MRWALVIRSFDSRQRSLLSPLRCVWTAIVENTSTSSMIRQRPFPCKQCLPDGTGRLVSALIVQFDLADRVAPAIES